MPILSQQKQSQAPDFPNVRPSLDLRFALAKKLDPRITFTRGSTGTYFGPDGLMKTAGVNEPRFDHDPVTGQSLGLLIEEQRTNLLRYSQNHDVVGTWINQSSTSNANVTEIIAPDGTNTATKLIGNSGARTRQSVYQTISVTSGVTYTFSVFLKAAERRYVCIWFDSFNVSQGPYYGAANYIDLQTGTIPYEGTSGAIKVVPYPNGWYRLYVTATPTITGSFNFNTAIGTPNNYSDTSIPNTYKYTGDGRSGIYMWGSQVEVGPSNANAPFPTSYIPTTASTATRTADTANITNISSFFNASEGTLCVDSEIPYQTNLRFPSIGFTRGAGSGNTIQFFYYNTNTPYIQYLVRDTAGGAITTVAISSPNQTVGVYKKFIATYKVGEYNYYFDGKLVGRSTTNKNLPSNLSMLEIGTNSPSGPDRLNGHIRRITYYPIALTNQQLINLTS